MEVKVYIPHPALQEYVLSIATIHAVLPDGVECAVTPYPPTPFQSLMFYCNDPVSMCRDTGTVFEKQPLTVLVGPQFSRVNIKIHKQLRAVRVDFLPGGLFRILGISMTELFDQGFNAQDFFGSEMHRLNEQLQELTDLEQGKTLVENFLLKKLSGLTAKLPFDNAMHFLLQNSGNMTMETTASLSCLSMKQFERKCKERIGMNPKLYARILKFSKAYRLREAFPELTWTAIAYQAGYYDQMHMIRDFKVFAGVNPSVIERHLQGTTIRMQKDLYY